MAELPKVLHQFVLGLAHVGYVVPDMDAALGEAKRLYGLSDVDIDRPAFAGEDVQTLFAFFSVGDTQFEYIQPCSEHFKTILLGMPSGGGGINHLAWLVSDIEAAMAALAGEGICPGHVTPDGIIDIGPKRMVYLDPATTGGLVLELIQDGPTQ